MKEETLDIGLRQESPVHCSAQTGTRYYYNALGESDCSKHKAWNPSGSGTMWEDWGFPIFLVQDANSTASLYQCWSKHNQAPLSWPLCSVELKGNMYAAKDSQTCIRRSNLFNITPLTVCDPLSDSNTMYWVRCRNAITPSTESENRGKGQECDGGGSQNGRSCSL